jgi:hypothetical protein
MPGSSEWLKMLASQSPAKQIRVHIIPLAGSDRPTPPVRQSQDFFTSIINRPRYQITLIPLIFSADRGLETANGRAVPSFLVYVRRIKRHRPLATQSHELLGSRRADRIPPSLGAEPPSAAKSGKNSQVTVRKRLTGSDRRVDRNRIATHRAPHAFLR